MKHKSEDPVIVNYPGDNTFPIDLVIVFIIILIGISIISYLSYK